MGTGLKVPFEDEGSEIVEKKSSNVLLRSKKKGEMYPLNLNPIRGKPAICYSQRLTPMKAGYGIEDSHT